MPRTRLQTLLIGLIFLTLTPSLAQSPASRSRVRWAEVPAVDRFDAFVRQAFRDWQVPGLTVTVVRDGQVLYKKAYGVRQTEGPGAGEPVNTQTLFAMASTTKAMTAACLGMLVDEGKLQWDDPVTNYLPDFQLSDPFVTRQLRVRDLLIHNSGVGNADFLWTSMRISSEEVLRRMRYLPPAYSLRSGFIYQNIMYLAAGKVIEKVSGQPWEVFIRQRIFEPLGMRRTRALFGQVTDPNRARPHVSIRDSVRLMPDRNEESAVDAIGPAGSVWTCADEVVAWMQCMLDSGRYQGRQLLKPATWIELFRPQTIVPDAQFYPTQQLTKPSWKTYGLGWFQHDYRGQRVNFHTGSLTGMVAIHGQLPASRLAVYVQANVSGAELRHAILYKAFDVFGADVLLPAPERDWSTEFQQLYGRIRAQATAAERRTDSLRVANTRPSLPVTAYPGTYEDPLSGTIRISDRQGRLRLVVNETLRGTLTHWHYDTFRLTFDNAWEGTEMITFGLDPDGTISRLTVGADGPSFSRKAGSQAVVVERR